MAIVDEEPVITGRRHRWEGGVLRHLRVWLRRWMGMMEAKSNPCPDLIRHDLGSRTDHPIGPDYHYPVLLIPLYPDHAIVTPFVRHHHAILSPSNVTIARI